MMSDVLSQPGLLLLIFLGVGAGILVGAVPGLTGAMLISLTLPLTFGMGGHEALTLLVSMYVGSVSGGLITATLLQMPGTPASVITTLDGFPMARSGRAGRALALGIGASFFGGILSWVVLVLLARPIAEYSTALGPFEYFALVVMALVLIAGVSGDSLVRGAFSGALGVLFALPGVAPGSGELRLTFGFEVMNDGFKLLPVLIGMFAMSRVLAGGEGGGAERFEVAKGGLWLKLGEWRRQLWNLVRSSVIGTGVGILPGVGANVGSLIAYSTARWRSKTPGEFGKGCDEGVVASESANNATVGGALVPLVALGIPGSVIDAILLGAFVIHGLQPGPMLFENDPEVVGTITSTYLWANFVMAGLMLVSVRWIARLAAVPRHYLLPVVAVFCVVGSYALANRFFDVWVMLGSGVAGYLLERFRVPLAPFVIGFVLTPIGEEKLVSALMGSGGSWWPMVTRPGSLGLLCVSGLLLWWALRQRGKAEKLKR